MSLLNLELSNKPSEVSICFGSDSHEFVSIVQTMLDSLPQVMKIQRIRHRNGQIKNPTYILLPKKHTKFSLIQKVYTLVLINPN